MCTSFKRLLSRGDGYEACSGHTYSFSTISILYVQHLSLNCRRLFHPGDLEKSFLQGAAIKDNRCSGMWIRETVRGNNKEVFRTEISQVDTTQSPHDFLLPKTTVRRQEMYRHYQPVMCFCCPFSTVHNTATTPHTGSGNSCVLKTPPSLHKI